MENQEKQISELISRIEDTINKTPTGELRNLLCDINITIQHLTQIAQPTTLIEIIKG